MPFHGVASELDATSDRRVRDLWAELDRGFGVRRAAELVPAPHVSYQVAGEYDFAALDRRLAALAPALRPITIQTTGLGVFAGPQPVLHLAVARTPALDALHRAVWDAIGEAGREYSDYYRPTGAWAPHITLAQFDLTPDNLAAIVARLAFRPLSWEITLASLSVARCDRHDAPCALWRRYPFAAAG